jgi:hypothetical protein
MAKRGRTIIVEKHVEVEIDLSEFDTATLIEELRARPDRAARELFASQGQVISDTWEERKRRDRMLAA